MADGQSRAWRRFLDNRGAVAGAIVIALIVTLALLAPLLSGHDPLAQDFEHGLTELGAPVAPSAEYPMGTDILGRSVWSRLAHGARLSLEVGFMATFIAVIFGVLIGLVAGYFGGPIDNLLMRGVDMVLAFPFLLLAILLAALLRESSLGDGTAKVFLTLGVVGWTTMARVVRGKVLSLRERTFIESARAAGARTSRILYRHLLPNVLGTVAIVATIGMAQMILAESVLSYLGLGPPPRRHPGAG